MTLSVTKSIAPAVNAHILKWRHCQACEQCHGRGQVMFFRGYLPAKVLFVATGPDIHSDCINQVLYDRLFDDIVDPSYRWAVTYLVSCGPTADETTPDAAKLACTSKFLEMVALAQPRLIVSIGKAATIGVVKNIQTISTVVPCRPIFSDIPGLFWIQKQKDQVLATQKCKLQVLDLITKYSL